MTPPTVVRSGLQPNSLSMSGWPKAGPLHRHVTRRASSAPLRDDLRSRLGSTYQLKNRECQRSLRADLADLDPCVLFNLHDIEHNHIIQHHNLP